MSLLVKICGVTTPQALEAALAAGADAVGFVFFAPSPRNLSPRQAAALASQVPRGVKTVAVTLHPAQPLVDEVLAAFLPDLWQTDAQDFARIELPAGVERWPVFRDGAALPAALPTRLL